MSEIAALQEQIHDLYVRVEKLENERPGRKATPMVAPDQPGVCGLDPECNSAECESASVYRYQQGCRGTACVQANSEYYAAYRKKRREEEAAAVS
jgi:hypothetical protein